MLANKAWKNFFDQLNKKNDVLEQADKGNCSFYSKQELWLITQIYYLKLSALKCIGK